MFGVVLWSGDEERNRAVIWCEDHGDLAYFDAYEHPGAVELLLEAGDLVRFDVDQSGARRLVRNPSVIAGQHFPGLASNLKSADGRATPPGAGPVPEAEPEQAPDLTGAVQRASAIIIPFVSAMRRRTAVAEQPDDQRWTMR